MYVCGYIKIVHARINRYVYEYKYILTFKTKMS